jgi:hypothetical protein
MTLGFPELRICSTGFGRIDLLHLRSRASQQTLLEPPTGQYAAVFPRWLFWGHCKLELMLSDDNYPKTLAAQRNSVPYLLSESNPTEILMKGKRGLWPV